MSSGSNCLSFRVGNFSSLTRKECVHPSSVKSNSFPHEAASCSLEGSVLDLGALLCTNKLSSNRWAERNTAECLFFTADYISDESHLFFSLWLNCSVYAAACLFVHMNNIRIRKLKPKESLVVLTFSTTLLHCDWPALWRWECWIWTSVSSSFFTQLLVSLFVHALTTVNAFD